MTISGQEPKEEFIIIRNTHQTIPYTHQQLAANGYEWSYDGVKRHGCRTGLRSHRHYLTVEQVAAGFGVDPETVEGWIERGLLRVLEVDKTEATYLLLPEQISSVWVLKFCRSHPNEYEASQMDEAWRCRFMATNEMVNGATKRLPLLIT